MAKILFTGGSGFIGTQAVTIAAASGYDILNLDIAPPNDPAHRPYWRELDIRHRDALIAAVAAFAPDYVLHLASDTDVAVEELAAFTTTIQGTRNVIDAAEAVPTLKRMVHVSTQYAITPGSVPAGERTLEPYTVYGEAKAETERMMWASRLPSWLIARPAIIWGPGHTSFPDLIWRYIAQRSYLHPATRPPIMRTYGYVKNTAWQMMRMVELDTAGVSARMFYLGDAVTSYDEWADAFSRAFTGKRARRIPVQALWLLAMAGEAARLARVRFPMNKGRYFRMTTPAPLPIEATHAALGAPPISFEQGLDETTAWLAATHGDVFKPRAA